MITPRAGYVLLSPILHSEQLARDVKSRSGLLVVTQHDNKHSFEGVPSQGIVRALPEGYDGEINIGAHAIFSEQSPKGFEHVGEKYFIIGLDKVVALVGVQ